MKKNIICILINTLVMTALCVNVYSYEKVPPETFSIGGATIGVTTLDEIQKIYGKGEPAPVSHEEEADIIICYKNSFLGGFNFTD